ncbi:NosD domain-containing protein [Cellulomonas sp. 179-A 4D5 NHS]|uniref:NosD domain-containing protein n=1 Tax=Cellulomonas sp. 179-A 4D5 NHS TaxID=3142378 RepID=UPI0039A082E1
MHLTTTAGLALALTLSLSPTPTPSPTTDPTPQQPACGATLTTDTLLTADLVCASGSGLRLVGPITLDLGGHTVRGPGADGGTGILFDNATNQVIRNGTVEGWGSGIKGWNEFPEGSVVPSTLSELLVRDNDDGVTGFTAELDITRSRFTDNTTGLRSALWTSVRVDRSTFARNGFAVHSGAQVAITGSTFVDNELALSATDGAVDVTSSRFARNTTTASEHGGDLVLTDNTVTDSEVGVTGGLFGHTVLTSNTFRRNVVAVDVVDTMTLRRNDFVGNGTAVRAVDPNEVGAIADLDGDTFRRNGDAIYATAFSRIANVTAVRNTGWGIYAPAAADGGGNVARGNGNEPQCVGVVCSAR